MSQMSREDAIVNYELAGSSGPAVVFIHGFGSSLRDWEHQREYFSVDYQIVLPDLVGHGRSTRGHSDMSMCRHARDIRQLLQQLGFEKAHIIGISMGAMIALQFALDYPEMTSSVVATNTPADMRPRGLKMRLLVLQRKLLVRILGMRKVGDVLSKRLFPEPEHADIRTVFASRWAENSVPDYMRQLHAILQWHIVEQLADIQVPVLVLVSDGDYTPLAAKELIASRLPQAELVLIENSRHALPVERPDAFNKAVGSFLNSVR